MQWRDSAENQDLALWRGNENPYAAGAAAAGNPDVFAHHVKGGNFGLDLQLARTYSIPDSAYMQYTPLLAGGHTGCECTVLTLNHILLDVSIEPPSADIL